MTSLLQANRPPNRNTSQVRISQTNERPQVEGCTARGIHVVRGAHVVGIPNKSPEKP